MGIKITRGTMDQALEQIVKALEVYQGGHPAAQIDLYRQNPVSVRVRIIDPDFKEVSRAERNRMVWAHLNRLPDEVQSDVSMLLLLAPEETQMSFANFEFDDPVPSRL